MYHFGFHVDDAEAVAQRIKEIILKARPKRGQRAPAMQKLVVRIPTAICLIYLLGDGVKNHCRKIKADRALEKTIAVQC